MGYVEIVSYINTKLKQLFAVFYIVAILVLPLSVLAVIALPMTKPDGISKRRRLDIPGVFILTGGMILFVYAISDANHVGTCTPTVAISSELTVLCIIGWAKPQILVTLIMSVIFVVSFFYIERAVEDPAVPPSTWSNKNFLPLFIYCLTYVSLLTRGV